VHQDGLVHISALSHQFVKDPHDVVKTGEIVKVKVMNVDEKRRRIALSMRLNDSAEEESSVRRRNGRGRGRSDNSVTQDKSLSRSAQKRSSLKKQSQTAADQPSALAEQLKAALGDNLPK
jgi:uncharacterized protein